MSLIDLNGSYRRVDGGIGLALANPQFVLEVEQTESGITLEFLDSVTDEEAILECKEKIPDAAQKTIEHFNMLHRRILFLHLKNQSKSVLTDLKPIFILHLTACL